MYISLYYLLFQDGRVLTIISLVVTSQAAKDLLKRLLVRDPKGRLGSGEQDADEIKGHPFFQDIDWSRMATGTLPPPWTPAVAGSLDTSLFDAEFTSMMPAGPELSSCLFLLLCHIFTIMDIL